MCTAMIAFVRGVIAASVNIRINAIGFRININQHR